MGSVLDDMTKGITERKAAAAGPKLTPVGVEGNVKPSLAVPSDLPGRYMAAEDLGQAAADLRKHAATLIATADAIDALIVETSQVKDGVDPKKAAAAALKAAEAAADAAAKERGFAKEFATLQEAAKAAVFAAADDTVGEPIDGNPNTPEVSATGGWQCPDHGDTDLKQLTSRKGRDYAACQAAGCRQFEKE